MKQEETRPLTEEETRDVNGGMTIVPGDTPMPSGDGMSRTEAPNEWMFGSSDGTVTNTDVNPGDINRPQV